MAGGRASKCGKYIVSVNVNVNLGEYFGSEQVQEEAPQTNLWESVVAGSLWLGCQWLVERTGATTQVIGEAGMRWRLTADRWAGCILEPAVTATMRLVWLVVQAKMVWFVSVWVFRALEEGTAKRHGGMHVPLIPSSHLQGLVDLHLTRPPQPQSLTHVLLGQHESYLMSEPNMQRDFETEHRQHSNQHVRLLVRLLDLNAVSLSSPPNEHRSRLHGEDHCTYIQMMHNARGDLRQWPPTACNSQSDG